MCCFHPQRPALSLHCFRTLYATAVAPPRPFFVLLAFVFSLGSFYPYSVLCYLEPFFLRFFLSFLVFNWPNTLHFQPIPNFLRCLEEYCFAIVYQSNSGGKEQRIFQLVLTQNSFYWYILATLSLHLICIVWINVHFCVTYFP